jgi:hypothetical protein
MLSLMSLDTISHVVMSLTLISILNVQPWPIELPLITMLETADGTAQEGLDMGVVLYSCSFVVISLMILSQVSLGKYQFYGIFTFTNYLEKSLLLFPSHFLSCFSFLLFRGTNNTFKFQRVSGFP